MRGGEYRAYFQVHAHRIVVGELRKKTKGEFPQRVYQQIEAQVVRYAGTLGADPRDCGEGEVWD